MMVTTEIRLSVQEHNALHMIALQTSKSENDLPRQAIKRLITQFQPFDRRPLLQQARGMWRDRSDLPDWQALRQEFDRMDLLSV